MSSQINNFKFQLEGFINTAESLPSKKGQVAYSENTGRFVLIRDSESRPSVIQAFYSLGRFFFKLFVCSQGYKVLNQERMSTTLENLKSKLIRTLDEIKQNIRAEDYVDSQNMQILIDLMKGSKEQFEEINQKATSFGLNGTFFDESIKNQTEKQLESLEKGVRVFNDFKEELNKKIRNNFKTTTVETGTDPFEIPTVETGTDPFEIPTVERGTDPFEIPTVERGTDPFEIPTVERGTDPLPESVVLINKVASNQIKESKQEEEEDPKSSTESNVMKRRTITAKPSVRDLDIKKSYSLDLKNYMLPEAPTQEKNESKNPLFSAEMLAVQRRNEFYRKLQQEVTDLKDQLLSSKKSYEEEINPKENLSSLMNSVFFPKSYGENNGSNTADQSINSNVQAPPPPPPPPALMATNAPKKNEIDFDKDLMELELQENKLVENFEIYQNARKNLISKVFAYYIENNMICINEFNESDDRLVEFAEECIKKAGKQIQKNVFGSTQGVKNKPNKAEIPIENSKPKDEKLQFVDGTRDLLKKIKNQEETTKRKLNRYSNLKDEVKIIAEDIKKLEEESQTILNKLESLKTRENLEQFIKEAKEKFRIIDQKTYLDSYKSEKEKNLEKIIKALKDKKSEYNEKFLEYKNQIGAIKNSEKELAELKNQLNRRLGIDIQGEYKYIEKEVNAKLIRIKSGEEPIPEKFDAKKEKTSLQKVLMEGIQKVTLANYGDKSDDESDNEGW
ncbi:MAG: hypothetical protein Tsb0021_15520 [Chlamydiales bacterium]